MKYIIFTGLAIMIASHAQAQRFKVRQSMETADQREEPAQFQITAPNKEKATFLFNAGMSFRIDDSTAHSFLSKITAEYHRNTSLEEEQNNFSMGYAYTYRFSTSGNTEFFSVGDAKYIYDDPDSAHSVGGNILFSWYRDGTRLNWNTNNFRNGNHNSFFVSLFGGTQYQRIFKSDKPEIKGFILRPTYTANAAFSITDASPGAHPPIVRLSLLYTGRYDLVNTSDVKEDYTNLFKAGIDWFIIRGPVKLSLGASYNTGSDPMQGLKSQSYWLFTLNFMK